MEFKKILILILIFLIITTVLLSIDISHVFLFYKILKGTGLALLIFSGIYLITSKKILWSILITLLAFIFLGVIPFFFSNVNVVKNLKDVQRINVYDNVKDSLEKTNIFYIFLLPVLMFTSLIYILIYNVVEEVRSINFLLLYFFSLLLTFLYFTYFYFVFYNPLIEADLKLYEQYYN